MSTAAPDLAVEAALAELAVLGDRVCENVALAPLTTYRVGGPARIFVRVVSADDLGALARAVRASGLPVLVVGRGSNLLVADSGFAGIAVQLGEPGEPGGPGESGLIGGISVDGTVVAAGGGVPLPVLARRTAAGGLSGFEWAVGVPGTLGGAVRMNAGGHGSDIAASLIDAHVYDLRLGRGRAVAAAELGLGFRSSALAAHQLVLSARLQLRPGDRTASEREIAEIVRWRREHQPGGQNAGSVFVNPVPGRVAAAQLIDGLGLRGMRIGSAEVSLKHANFVQADEGGRADDVLALIEAVRAKVAEAHGIALRSEVRLVGFPGAKDVDGAGVVL